MKKFGLLVTAGALAFFAAQANAGVITTYSGLDQGVSSVGPVAQGVQSNFLSDAAGFGPVVTETFESIPVDTAVYGGSFAIIDGTATIATSYGDPYSGVLNDGPGGPLYGFNTTPGGSKWLGFAGGSATFTFNKPTNSFGFFTTGLQKEFTAPGQLNVTFNDGTSEVLNLPINKDGGGDSYFGFTDTVGISSIKITNGGDDAWGIDDVSYNASAVPEPATWAMMLLGLGGLGAALRSHRRAARDLAALNA